MEIMSQEIAVFLTHPVTFSYHYKPITYVTLSQVPKKKKSPFTWTYPIPELLLLCKWLF